MEAQVEEVHTISKSSKVGSEYKSSSNIPKLLTENNSESPGDGGTRHKFEKSWIADSFHERQAFPIPGHLA